MRRPFNSRIEYPQLLQLSNIIVNNHPAAADDRHLANLSRIQPAVVNNRRTILPETQAHRRHVFHARRHMRHSAAIHRERQFFHDMKDDRNIMRCQVPCHVDIFLVEPEVQAPCRDVTYLTEVA